jgi:hypothetical protein
MFHGSPEITRLILMATRFTRGLLFGLVLSLYAMAANAQELSPRAYWPAPNGTKVAVFGYQYSWGDVVTDPSLPIYGVDSRISTGLAACRQTFKMVGRTANFLVELPYTWGTSVGELHGEPARRGFSGIGDIAVTLSVNLVGAPSMTPAEFQELRANPHPTLGASVKVLAPTGVYDDDRIINVGANRWAMKVELGYMVPIRARWLFEIEMGAWVFSDNDAFVVGTREQASILATEFHLVGRFRPGFWVSLALNFYSGGRSTFDGRRLGDLQRNARIGGTVVVPFRGRHAVKVGYSTGIVTGSGGDYNMLLLSYQVLFR